MTLKTVTLADLDVRYQNIRKNNPKIKNCSVKGCFNPVDSTEHLGEDSCCAYHRLLFDFWGSDVLSLNEIKQYVKSQKGRRRAFTNWMKRIGKEQCDEIVLKLAQEPINWVC